MYRIFLSIAWIQLFCLCENADPLLSKLHVFPYEDQEVEQENELNAFSVQDFGRSRPIRPVRARNRVQILPEAELITLYKTLFSYASFREFTGSSGYESGMWLISRSVSQIFETSTITNVAISQFKSDNPELEFRLRLARTQAYICFIIKNPLHHSVVYLMNELRHIKTTSVYFQDFWRKWYIEIKPKERLTLIAPNGYRITVLNVPDTLNDLLSTDPRLRYTEIGTPAIIDPKDLPTNVLNCTSITLKLPEYDKMMKVDCPLCQRSFIAANALNNMKIFQAIPNTDPHVLPFISYEPKSYFMERFGMIRTMCRIQTSLLDEMKCAEEKFSATVKNVRILSFQLIHDTDYTDYPINELLQFMIKIARVFVDELTKRAALYGYARPLSNIHDRKTCKLVVIWDKATITKYLKFNKLLMLDNGFLSHRIQPNGKVLYSINGLLKFTEYDRNNTAERQLFEKTLAF